MGITVIGILTGIYSGEKITDSYTFLNQMAFLLLYTATGIATAIVDLLLLLLQYHLWRTGS